MVAVAAASGSYCIYTATRPNYVPGMQHQPLQFIAKSPGKSMKQWNKQQLQHGERGSRDNCIEGSLFGCASFKKFQSCSKIWLYASLKLSSSFMHRCGGKLYGDTKLFTLHIATEVENRCRELSKHIHLPHSNVQRFRYVSEVHFRRREKTLLKHSL